MFTCGWFIVRAVQPVFWLDSQKEVWTAFSVSVCCICTILLLCLGLRIAYRLFMTAKSRKSRWARTVIIVENGAQWPVEERCQIDSCRRVTQAPSTKKKLHEAVVEEASLSVFVCVPEKNFPSGFQAVLVPLLMTASQDKLLLQFSCKSDARPGRSDWNRKYVSK